MCFFLSLSLAISIFVIENQRVISFNSQQQLIIILHAKKEEQTNNNNRVLDIQKQTTDAIRHNIFNSLFGVVSSTKSMKRGDRRGGDQKIFTSLRLLL